MTTATQIKTETEHERYRAITKGARELNRKEQIIQQMIMVKNYLIEEAHEKRRVWVNRKDDSRAYSHAAALVERDLAILLENEGMPSYAKGNYMSAAGSFSHARKYQLAVEMYQEAGRLGGSVDDLIKQVSEKLGEQAQ